MSAGNAGATQDLSVSDADNAAWASAEIPWSGSSLLEFLADIERLIRLNPHLDIEEWHRIDLPAGASYRVVARNESNAWHGEMSFRLMPTVEGDGYDLVYTQGLKQSTQLRIRPGDGSSILTITDRYHPVTDSADPRLCEVDRSLIAWVAAIRAHLSGLARFGGIPGYRWWRERVMLPMSPRQRRMVRMIAWISLLEFAVFLFVVLIYRLEHS